MPAKSEEESKTIWQRAKQKIGTAYDTVNYNCEHFTRWCFEGTEMSTQVRNAILKLAAGTAVTVGIGYGAYKFLKWLRKDENNT